jgi:aminopeptidase
MIPFRELISRNHTNWSVIATAGAAWAAKVFPDAPADQRFSQLRDTIDRLCRLDRPDPVAAWQQHIAALAARSDYLNRKRYTALKFSGPGTNLTVGLPEAHLGERCVDEPQQHPFVANLPTEEVFTIADRHRVAAPCASTKPLSYGGTLIEDFHSDVRDGRVVEFTAGRRRNGAAAAGRDRPGRRTARRGGARAAQLAGSPSRAASSTTRCSTRTPPATSRSARPTSSRSPAATR